MNRRSTFAEVFDTAAQRHVARKLEELFSTELRPGQRLPPERTLAKQFGVSRPTLRNVLGELERRQLIQTGQRGQRKTRHAPHPPPAAQTVLTDTIVLVTDLPGVAHVPAGRPTGWSGYVYTGASEMIHEQKLHVLNVRHTSLIGTQIEQLIAEHPRGVVVLDNALQSANGRQLLDRAQAAHLPVVVEGLSCPALAGFDTVGPDHEAGAYQLTKWLIARGARRILRYYDRGAVQQRPVWLRARDCGTEHALTAAGLTILPPVFHPDVGGPPDTPQAFTALAHAVADVLVGPVQQSAPTPDAIMAISDGYVPVLAAACRLLRQTPNRDIALVGYDNYWLESPERRWEPTAPLATIDKLNPQIGRALVQLLLDRIAGQLPVEPQHRLVQSQFVEVAGTPGSGAAPASPEAGGA